MKKHPIVPGRGLNTENATNYRLDFLKANGIEVPLLADSQLHRTQIQHNKLYVCATFWQFGFNFAIWCKMVDDVVDHFKVFWIV